MTQMGPSFYIPAAAFIGSAGKYPYPSLQGCCKRERKEDFIILRACASICAPGRHGQLALSLAHPCGYTSRTQTAAEGCHTLPPAWTYLPSGLLTSGHCFFYSHAVFSNAQVFIPAHRSLPSSAQERRMDCKLGNSGSTGLAYVKFSFVNQVFQRKTQLICKGRLAGSLGEATSTAEPAIRLSSEGCQVLRPMQLCRAIM